MSARNELLVGDWLRRVEYKPEWSFHVGPETSVGDVMLRIELRVVDTYNPSSRRIIQFGAVAPAHTIDATMPVRFFRWLFNTVQELERHEAAEWFRVSGVMVADPHRPEPDGTPTRRLTSDVCGGLVDKAMRIDAPRDVVDAGVDTLLAGVRFGL